MVRWQLAHAARIWSCTYPSCTACNQAGHRQSSISNAPCEYAGECPAWTPLPRDHVSSLSLKLTAATAGAHTGWCPLDGLLSTCQWVDHALPIVVDSLADSAARDERHTCAVVGPTTPTAQRCAAMRKLAALVSWQPYATGWPALTSPRPQIAPSELLREYCTDRTGTEGFQGLRRLA